MDLERRFLKEFSKYNINDDVIRYDIIAILNKKIEGGLSEADNQALQTMKTEPQSLNFIFRMYKKYKKRTNEKYLWLWDLLFTKQYNSINVMFAVKKLEKNLKSIDLFFKSDVNPIPNDEGTTCPSEIKKGKKNNRP